MGLPRRPRKKAIDFIVEEIRLIRKALESITKANTFKDYIEKQECLCADGICERCEVLKHLRK